MGPHQSTLLVRVLAGFTLGGAWHRKGETIEVDRRTAFSLMRSGLAERVQGRGPERAVMTNPDIERRG